MGIDKYQLIIFDFHKTLTDTVYFDHFDPETRNLISDLVFRPPNNKLWDKRWMSGALGYTEVLRHLSEKMVIPYKKLEEELFMSLKNIHWNQPIWEFSQSVRKTTKTAIATINTDLFNEFVVPHYDLSRKFDAILNSYEEGHDNKTEMCKAIAGKFGLNLRDNRILLIDDKKKNIDDFVSAGGEGFRYESAEMFAEFMETGEGRQEKGSQSDL